MIFLRVQFLDVNLILVYCTYITFKKILGLLTISDGKAIAYVVFRDNYYASCYKIFTIYKLKFGIGFRELRGSVPSIAMTFDNLFQMILCFYHGKKVADLTVF